ncbi:hypothetical protein CR152_09655 [Massilia violaceinigra]|uniref:PEP-CTERM sorting domain-containing protein n=1 Tax=Massilia violaceinigra TaxID=2045208 RepID=A0A2D2DIG2_9BURK|nr:DUF642 domain-containing protein [Massilia violaceinigra]ATQ74757.1 hypothetical protein CR152_09655 [Massilia violaceinigra]
MKSSVLLGGLFAAAMFASGAARADLVVNGSFEVNKTASSWQNFNAVTGWNSSNGIFEIQKGAKQGGAAGFNPYAANGRQYLELNSTGLSSVWQMIDTSVAGTYSVSFAYSGRPDTAGHANSAMNVYWGDTKLNDSLLMGGTTGQWSLFSITDLVATSPLTKLRFESVGPSSSPTYGSYLDAVSVDVTPVPEPETYALFLLGLAIVGATVRRNKKA